MRPGATKAALVVFAQYWPSKPVPLPMDELLMKLALTGALATDPALNAMAVTATEFVSTKGAL